METSFSCSCCGICCGDTKEKTRHILLLNQEVEEITKKSALAASDFCFEVQGKAPYIFEMRKQADGKCVFLENNKCSIYAFRPLICRFYPFELKPVGNGYLFDVTSECPGIGVGDRLGKQDFLKLFLLAKERLNK